MLLKHLCTFFFKKKENSRSLRRHDAIYSELFIYASHMWCCIHRGLSIVEQHTECIEREILNKKKKDSNLDSERERSSWKEIWQQRICYRVTAHYSVAAAAREMNIFFFCFISNAFQVYFSSHSSNLCALHLPL